MEFGKLANIADVDFSLPPDALQNDALYDLWASKERLAAPKIYLGATGYNMRSWVGKWYPLRTKTADYLTAYGRQFDMIEHNTTYYRIPDEALVARWYEEVPAGFRYCPKVPQMISHSRHLGVGGDFLPDFCTKIMRLEEKLGCCCIQLPPYFDVARLNYLEDFLENWNKAVPLAVEVRHPSFFGDSLDAEYYWQLLQNHGVAVVITDVAGRRDVCHSRLTNSKVLVRLVGNGMVPSDYVRLQAWATRLKYWFDKGLEEAYICCHQPDNELAPDYCVAANSVFADKMPNCLMKSPLIFKEEAVQGKLFD